jgi:signal transduction histidine kinase
MRALLLELRPDDLTDVGLDELIDYLIAALECRRTLSVRVDLTNVDLEPDVHHVFYRVAQEALRNITQHAEAEAVEVRLSDGPTVELRVVDDGHGFDPAEVPSGHLGLAIMHERAASVGALLDIVSQPGRGTSVVLRYARRMSPP